jgi:hypothetical protein
VDWYEEIFSTIARRAELESAESLHDETVQRRVIMNFSQTGISVDRIVSSLRAMIGQGHFSADLVIVDGYNFGSTSREDIEAFRCFARDMNLSIWFSVSVPSDDDAEDLADERRMPGFLDPYADQFTTIIGMRATEGFVSLRLLKDHDVSPVPDLRLRLDPKTLLVEE